MLAMSPLFPEHLRKGSMESALANGVLVINMAMRLREDPLTVAQNIYFVGGKPYRAALPNSGEVVAGLYAMAHRQTFGPDGDDLINDTIRLLEYARKRSLL